MYAESFPIAVYVDVLKSMRINRYLSVLLAIVLSGCASTPQTSDESIPLTDAYCGRFFIYNMCAVDYNDNGIVDGVHFEDTNEVFLYREEARNTISHTRPLHVCAQVIDEELGNVANKLLTIVNTFTVGSIT